MEVDTEAERKRKPNFSINEISLITVKVKVGKYHHQQVEIPNMGRNNERRECGGESKSYCSRSKRQVGESPLDRKQKQKEKQNRRNFVTSQKMASITSPLPWMKLFLLGNDIVGINDSFIFAVFPTIMVAHCL